MWLHHVGVIDGRIHRSSGSVDVHLSVQLQPLALRVVHVGDPLRGHHTVRLGRAVWGHTGIAIDPVLLANELNCVILWGSGSRVPVTVVPHLGVVHRGMPGLVEDGVVG